MKFARHSEIAVGVINPICTGRDSIETPSWYHQMIFHNFKVWLYPLLSFKFRTLSEIFVCLLLIVFFFLHNDIIGFLHPLFECDVYGLLFQCVVPNTKYLVMNYSKFSFVLFLDFSLWSISFLWWPSLDILFVLHTISSGSYIRGKKVAETRKLFWIFQTKFSEETPQWVSEGLGAWLHHRPGLQHC